MLDILFLTRSFSASIGGMEIHQTAFLRMAEGLGWRVTAMALDENLRYHECGWRQSIPSSVHVVFFNDLSWLCFVEELRRRFDDALFVVRSGGNDIIRAPYGDDHLSLKERQHKIVSLIKENIDYLLINSDYSYFRNLNVGIPSDRMLRVRGGVDDVLVNNLGKNRRGNRSRFDAEHGTCGKRIVVLTSRLEPFKGVLEFVDGLASQWEAGNFLLIVGDGSLYVTLHEQLESLLNHDSFLMMGALSHEHAMEMISIADVFVSSSVEYRRSVGNDSYIHTETMGRSIMEAVSLGVPVVATRVGGVEEILEEVPGAVVLVENCEECARAALNTPLNGAQNHLNSVYGWQNVFSVYERLFASRFENVFVLDLDGTVLGGSDAASSVAEYLKSMRIRGRIILNTARDIDSETIDFARQAGADAIIVRNGTKVIMNDNDENTWNKMAEKSFAQDRFLTELKREILQQIPEEGVKHAHVNTLVVRASFMNYQLRSWIMGRVDMRKDYHIEETERIMKIVHNKFNKRGAVEYVLKNWLHGHLFGAGDSISDMAFCSICDASLISCRMRPYCQFSVNRRVEYFEESEIGIPVLQRLFAMSETSRKDDLRASDLM